MNLDDELRRRMQAAADQAGAGVDPAALQASAAAAAAPRPPLRLLGTLGAAGLVVGAALGFTALQPRQAESAAPVVVQREQLSLFDCPDGAPVGVVYPGDRVYVVGRDDSGAWWAVRDPRDATSTRWLPAAAVSADRAGDVPTMTCAEAIALVAVGATSTSTTAVTTTLPAETTTTTVAETTTTATTSVAPTSPPVTTTPATAPPPTTTPDTQKPTAQASSNLAEIFDVSQGCESVATITAVVADNIGVTQVTGTWSGVSGSPKAFTKVNNTTWRLAFGPFSGLGIGFNAPISINVVARDAAGNTSNPVSVVVRVYGECLI